jgi:hypothetical protein
MITIILEEHTTYTFIVNEVGVDKVFFFSKRRYVYKNLHPFLSSNAAALRTVMSMTDNLLHTQPINLHYECNNISLLPKFFEARKISSQFIVFGYFFFAFL